MPLSAGAKLGPYEILSRIGAGGMGEVWKARDTRLDRIVAIKTSSAKFSDRFEREARAVAALNHPHICQLYDVGPDYLVMEYVEGSEIKGPLPLDQVLRLAIQLASALEAAHRQGITHRDLKPANILVTKSGIKVLDFGLAKFEQAKAVAASDETVTKASLDAGRLHRRDAAVHGARAVAGEGHRRARRHLLLRLRAVRRCSRASGHSMARTPPA